MTGPAPAAAVWGGVELLERAIGYMLGSLRLVTAAATPRPPRARSGTCARCSTT